MLRIPGIVLALCLSAAGADNTVTWTGWFSDYGCASGRVQSGIIEPTNPECAKSCIRKGAAPVFISEQAKAMFTVKDYPGVVDDLGYHVEVEAKVDEAAKTISIVKVTRHEYRGASCGRRPKTATKQ
jgi:hypothetical protein